LKVLIIRLSSIGDVILTTPIVRCLKHSISVEIDFLTNEVNLPILKRNPYISTIIFPDQLGPQDLKQYDYIIDLNNSRKSRKIYNRSYDTLIKTDKMPIRKWLMLFLKINLLNKSHTVDRHFDSVKSLSINNDGAGLDLFIDDHTNVPVPAPFSNYIVINAGGSKITKRIPKKLIEDVINMSERKYILIGGADVSTVYGGFNHPNCINLVNQLSLEQSFKIIKHCKLLITGDTAMMHAAAALQKPQIVIWGSTSDDFGFYPYYGSKYADQSDHIIQGISCQPCSKMGKDACPKGHMNCLTKIEAKEVLLKIDSATQHSSYLL